MKTYIFASFASVFIWGMYPVAVAVGGYSSPYVAAAASTTLAAILWICALFFSPQNGTVLLKRALTKWQIVLFSGVLFAAEVSLFYLAVNRSPQTAAVLFETWVIVFVFTSQIVGGKQYLSRKDWVFLIFGLIGISVAVVDVRSMLSGEGTIPDAIAVVFSLSSGVCMAFKTFLNSQLTKHLHDSPNVIIASFPHLLSSFVAVPCWILLAYIGGHSFTISATEIDGLLLVSLLYGIGIPMFIYSVAIRPNDSSMAVFYSIPLVAIALLSLFGFTDLTFYFVIGAVIIFVSNAMLSQNTPYVSAAGLASIGTLLATYFAISVHTDIIPVSSWGGDNDATSSIEILLVFYGLLFATILTKVVETNKLIHYKLDNAMILLQSEDMDPPSRRKLYRHLLNLNGFGRRHSMARPAFRQSEAASEVSQIEIEFRSLTSTNTPTSIFRVFSVGILTMVLMTFCISDSVLERLTGLLVLSCVLYFVFYSRDSYLRSVTYPMLFSEVLKERRGNQYLPDYDVRRGNHLVGLWLFVITTSICAALNIAIGVF